LAILAWADIDFSLNIISLLQFHSQPEYFGVARNTSVTSGLRFLLAAETHP